MQNNYIDMPEAYRWNEISNNGLFKIKKVGNEEFFPSKQNVL